MTLRGLDWIKQRGLIMMNPKAYPKDKLIIGANRSGYLLMVLNSLEEVGSIAIQLKKIKKLRQT